MLPLATLPDAQRVSDKEAPLGHLSQAVVSNNSWQGSSLQGLAEEEGHQVLNTQKQTHEKWYRNKSFLPFLTHKHPHCQGSVLEGKQVESITFNFGLQKWFPIQTSRQCASMDTGMGMVLSFLLCFLDSSSHWTSITPNRSGLHVSGRHTGKTQWRPYGAFSRMCSSGFIQAPLVYNLLGWYTFLITEQGAGGSWCENNTAAIPEEDL